VDKFGAWIASRLSQAVRESRRGKFLSELARKIEGEHLPRVAAEISCGYNMVLIFELKDPVQRGHQTTANGWSRSMTPASTISLGLKRLGIQEPAQSLES